MINETLKQKLISVGYKGGFNLSELIEACGDMFWRLERHEEHIFEAMNCDEGSPLDIKGKRVCVVGDKPLEAVAKLYIELNKK